MTAVHSFGPARYGELSRWVVERGIMDPKIEVGAPSVPAWQRTIDFYLRHGSEEVGHRLDLGIKSPE